LSQSISRRAFLKLGAYSTIGLAFNRMGLNPSVLRPGHTYPWLGRTAISLRYYDKPSIDSTELGYYVTDTVIQILDTSLGDPLPVHNPLWHRTEQGWIHSSFVQPVKDELQEPVWDIPAGGFLVEVSVPFSQSWRQETNRLKRAYKFYYASTHWVTAVSKDDYGTVWYRILNDLKGGYYYAPAEHFRRITEEELSPISPQVEDKKIIIDLAKQKMSAFENGRVVMSARISTGTFEGDTPLGEFRVERKTPSRHMALTESRGNGFDLPGVPWCCFISWTGVALHGTYWHNDYGQPRSHGCINLSPEASKWVYRWTLPHAPASKDYVESNQGTKVIVI